jgi:molecular chaperone DnaK
MWSWLSRLVRAPAAGSRTGAAFEPVLGIDLGFSACTVAVVHAGAIRVLPDADGMRRTPSVVARTPAGDWLTGLPALLQAGNNPHGTLFGLKTLLGRSGGEIPADPLGFHPPGVAGLDERTLVCLGADRYPPEQLVALLLRKLRQSAERELGCSVQRAVLAVPVFFDSVRRQAVLDAARIAGLEPLRLVTEPQATLLACAPAWDDATAAIVDIGAHHLSWTVADCEKGEPVVRAQGGREGHGGLALDRLLVEQVADAFRRQQGVDLRADPLARLRLREAVEHARCRLSEVGETTLKVADVPGRGGERVELQLELKRGRCDALFRPVLDRCRAALEALLREAKVPLGEVLLVGGLARMPRLRQVVADVLEHPLRAVENLEEGVAVGAALHGFQLSLGYQAEQVLMTATTHAFGRAVENGRVEIMIDRNTTFPTEKKEVLRTTTDNQTRLAVRVVEGEGTAGGWKHLDEVILDGLKPAPRGEGRVEVTLALDKHGVLTVCVRDLASGRQVTRLVHSRRTLTEADVARFRSEVAEWSREALRRAGFVRVCAEAERLLREVTDLLEQYYAILTDDDRVPLLRMMDHMRELMKGDSETVLRQELRDLELAAAGLKHCLTQRHGIRDPGSRPTAIQRLDID